MTTLFRGICAISLAGMVVSCGLLKKGGADAGDAEAEAAVAEVADAAPPVAAGPAAANENDIARFPDEKKLENVVATVQRPTNVREIPNTGKVVVAIAKGGTVTQIAQRTTFFLVVFAKPDGTKVMGWVSQDAFTALAADAGIKPLTCTAPETALISDTAFCGKICAADTDCPAGQACKGAANKLVNNAKGDPVTVCTVFGTQPNTVVALKDAGVAPVAPTASATPALANDVLAPVGGKCDQGFVLVAKDNQCHRRCIKVGGPTCVGGGTCIQCAGAKVCSPNPNLCK